MSTVQGLLDTVLFQCTVQTASEHWDYQPAYRQTKTDTVYTIQKAMKYFPLKNTLQTNSQIPSISKNQ